MPGGVRVWDVIRNLTAAGFNICKYTIRATQVDTDNNKGQTAAERLVDLKKARWYLDEAIEEAERLADPLPF